MSAPYWKVFLIIFLAAPLGAATYYVSPSGSDANSGTLGQPFQTLQAAVTHLSPGDTLLIRQGTYYGPLQVAQSGADACRAGESTAAGRLRPTRGDQSSPHGHRRDHLPTRKPRLS